MSPKVSVIMPSLNVAKYIGQCMESVLSQTLSDIEILAVDAGSTDGTLEIIKSYAAKDDRIHILLSEKKSYGYQLNMGIARAVGEYVGVVETDDIIMPDMLQVLYKKAVSANLDYVKGAKVFFIELREHQFLKFPDKFYFNDDNIYEKVIVPKETPELFIRDVYLWTGLYKKEFIKKVVMNETPGAAYQDTGFMFQVCTMAERAMYIADKVYLYRQDNMSASSYNRRGFSFLVGEYDYIKKFLPKLSIEWHEVYYCRMLDHCRRRFQIMGASGEFWQEALPEIEELRSRLKLALQQGILNKEKLDKDRCEKLEMFLESPKIIYENNFLLYKSKLDNIHTMFHTINNRKVVIFGCGKVGQFLRELIMNNLSDAVQCYCDNQEELWGTIIQEIPVMSPMQAAKLYPDAVYLITGRRYEAEMREQLKLLNIIDSNQFTYTAGVDFLLLQMK